MTGSSSKLESMPLPDDDPTQRQPDITLAREKLGWEPKVQLHDGLKKTIDYFKSIDLEHFRRPTDHTAHKSSGG
jgi:UDP-glucuronate decarboxylase